MQEVKIEHELHLNFSTQYIRINKINDLRRKYLLNEIIYQGMLMTYATYEKENLEFKINNTY
ncbi:hypothetical protein [Pelosinus propionicus]|uniref:Uncharacterized protein n=1 Tax=Pelosinus propionicus DSM 13327 TaxID=1123291 RepID=A0A1I4NQ22_9FIRM|nr:hypothetical protein [Pelosinus propionicus]SFM17440.1 hypothetical protein SAMN04490355_105021 [Pelosinus propionicus DSM 13327]